MYMSHSIISYLGSLNNKYSPTSVYFFNQKSTWIHDDFRISVWQATPVSRKLAAYSEGNLPLEATPKAS